MAQLGLKFLKKYKKLDQLPDVFNYKA